MHKEVTMETDLSRIERFRQFKQEIRGNERYLIVGIDVAKDRHHAFLGTANGRTVLRRLAVENSRNGFEHLVGHVQFQMRKHGLDDVVFGVEPTSVYHKPLAEYLIEKQFLVVYVTNAAIKQNRQLLDGRWDKHDAKDAANVADLVARGKCHYYDLPNEVIQDVRTLLGVRRRLKRQLHSARMRIRNNLVAQYFPELDKFWNNAEEENLAIVRWCLDPQGIRQLNFTEFFHRVTSRSKGTRQHRRLMGIWEAAPSSIGCRVGKALDVETRILVDDVKQTRERIAEVEQAIRARLTGLTHYEVLLSIPGFGPYICAVVLAAVGNPHRFENRSQLLRLAGLDLSANRSGKRGATAVPVISKSGKADLRYALYQAALVASSFNQHVTAYYRHLLKGREREPGIGTKMRVKLAAKLLIIAWTLMKKKEPFDPGCLNIA
jgi:transposase